MTVAGQVKQTIASLKGAQATLQTFASFEKTEAQEVFEQNAGRIGRVIIDLEKRLQTLEFAEPQYKGF
ncbi:MAG: DUF1657 domain-containing protein [Syntrophomonadaceae bacterium]|nr:DUF1657 domain-containing protein [Syntrophomonadaceae bacterium]